MILESKSAPKADFDNGLALVNAAGNGHVEVVRTLLEWPVNAPQTDCDDGKALIQASSGGHDTVVQLLLEWPVNAPLADCQDGEALVQAAGSGQESTVRLLMTWPINAPRADCQDGQALLAACYDEPDDVVERVNSLSTAKLLLEWPVNAPLADCFNGQALINTASWCHEPLVELLLTWPVNAPKANCQNGEALIQAAECSHLTVVQMLLDSNHAPLPCCQKSKAIFESKSGSYGCACDDHECKPCVEQNKVLHILVNHPKKYSKEKDPQTAADRDLVRAAKRKKYDGRLTLVRMMVESSVFPPSEQAKRLALESVVGKRENFDVVRHLDLI